MALVTENKPYAHLKTHLHVKKVYYTLPVSLTIDVLLIKIVLFFDHWSNNLFQINQRFQVIEFVERAIPEKLDMGFPFYGHEVLQVKYVTVKYKGTRINTSVTHR